MFVRFNLSVLLLLFSAHSAFASVCGEVVTDTVDELRVGFSGTLTAELEELLRSAAGSACVKALSGRYAEKSPQQETPMQVPSASAEVPREQSLYSETVRPPDSETAQPPTAVTARSANAEQTQAPVSETEQNAGSDDGWSFGGLKFRSLSGSPSSKPYERKRNDNDSDNEEQPDGLHP